MDGVKLPHGIEEKILLEPVFDWTWILLSVVGLALGLIVYMWLRKRRSRSIPEPTVEEKIRQKLNRLGLPANYDSVTLRQWSADLSLILRSAVESSWKIPATDRTNDELRQMLRTRSDPKEQKDELLELLSRLDLVQFADQFIDEGEGQKILQEAATLVESLLGSKP